MEFLKKLWGCLKSWLMPVLCGLLLAFIFSCFFQVAVVKGESMEPTLHNGQFLLLQTGFLKEDTIKRGDIIVASKEAPKKLEIVKRVIGLPGDHLEILENRVYINGEQLEEGYLREEMKTGDIDMVIPEGKLFVMGDNRNDSADSRMESIGLVDVQTELHGKRIF